MHIFPTYSGNSKLQGSTTSGYPVRPFQSPPFQSTSTNPLPPPPRPRHLQSTLSQYDSEEDELYDTEDDLETDAPLPPPPGSPHGLSILSSRHLIHPAVRDASLRLPPLLNHHAHTRQPTGYPIPGQGETLPPLYRQFMRELSSPGSNSGNNASGGGNGGNGSNGSSNGMGVSGGIGGGGLPPAPLPDVDPPSVPRETCVELRKYHINPAWVVLPPFGEPCHFRSKESCFRADWRNAMWERHIQTHLPSTMKEFWECPHCLRPFNRKCAFVNHLRKTKTECGSRGTLEMTPESRWKDLWFHEPMPLRHPEDVPRRRWHSTQKEEQML